VTERRNVEATLSKCHLLVKRLVLGFASNLGGV
jgi:hypothetical protein